MPRWPEKEPKLTVKQRRFIEEYLVDYHATNAAIRAGYSKKTAYVIASQNLTKLQIKAQIDKRLKELQDKTETLQERVVQEMRRLAFYDPRKIFDEQGNPKSIPDLDDDTAAVIGGFEVETKRCKTRTGKEEEDTDIVQNVTSTKKVRLADKNTALVSLGKHLGMFDKDNVKKLIGDKDNPVVHKIDMSDDLAEIMTLEQLEEFKRRAVKRNITE